MHVCIGGKCPNLAASRWLRHAPLQYLDVVVCLSEGLQAVREPADVAVQLPPLLPQQLFVEVDELEEALRSGVVVPALVLQEALRNLRKKKREKENTGENKKHRIPTDIEGI